MPAKTQQIRVMHVYHSVDLPSVYWSQSGSYLFVMPSYAAILLNGAPEQKKQIASLDSPSG
jgi:hypothetical protein